MFFRTFVIAIWYDVIPSCDMILSLQLSPRLYSASKSMSKYFPHLWIVVMNSSMISSWIALVKTCPSRFLRKKLYFITWLNNTFHNFKPAVSRIFWSMVGNLNREWISWGSENKNSIFEAGNKFQTWKSRNDFWVSVYSKLS